MLSEILDRLSMDGVITVRGSVANAARALDDELRLMDPYFERQDQAAAIIALRAAGWPPAQLTATQDRASFAMAASQVSHLLGSDDAHHVADLMRHAELSFGTAAIRPLAELLPVASRAITEYRRLLQDERVT